MNDDQNRVTLLLGAGASLPFIHHNGDHLSTAAITKRFCEDRQLWEELWSAFDVQRKRRSHADAYDDNLDINEVLHLITDLKRHLDNSPQFTPANFEHLVHLLDRAAFVLEARDAHDATHIDALLLSLSSEISHAFFSKYSKSSDYRGWRFVPSLSREVVVEIINRYWSSTDQKRVVVENRTFFDRLAANSDGADVFSLNYDPLILAALAPDDGTRPGSWGTGFLGSGAFDASIFRCPGTQLRLAFLHGSVAFAPNRSGRPTLEYGSGKARDRRIEYAVNNFDGSLGMKGIVAPNGIITGLDKFDAFSRNPYAMYIQVFAESICSCGVLVMIGYSFSDDHLNTFLLNAITSNPQVRVIIVDRLSPDEVDVGIRGSGKKVLTWLSALRDSIPMDMSHFTNVATQLSDRGYARLASHSVLFSRGTEDFFKHDLRSILEACS